MKVLIVVTMTNNFGKKGSYNSQEIGLARGLTELGHDVIVYKSVVTNEEVGEEKINAHAKILYIKCPYFGSNGFIPTRLLDKSADVLIQFADLQLSVPSVFSWTKKNGVKYIPYVGITWSQSPNKAIKWLVEMLGTRNFRIYKAQGCAAKNTSVAQQLKTLGVRNVQIAPVCIDFEQVNKECFHVDRSELREKWKVPVDARVILYVGRFDKDKRPVDLVHMINKLEDKAYLVMIGTGVLLDEVKKEIERLHLRDRVLIVERIPNRDIWQFYRMSDVFVNLNKTEIWGMVLLEAMYYRVGIVAADAPGPRCILENGKSGFIAESDEELLEFLKIYPFPEDIHSAAFDRVISEFRWKNSAGMILNVAK